MIIPKDYRRCLYVLLLLCVMISQWLVGGLYLKRTFVVEIRKEMTATEKVISSQIFFEYGFHPHITIVDEDEINFIQGLGYAAPFIHAVDINGAAQVFTLDEQTSHYHQLEVDLKSQRPDPDQQQRQISAERLFTKFCIEEPATLTLNQILHPEANFTLTTLRDLFDHSIPAPPPKSA